MGMNYTTQIVAGIYIGSYGIKMKIVEINENGQIKTIDFLKHTILLGKDTYTSGKLSFETVSKVCEILKSFKQLLREYNIKIYRVVATSAIREAENKDYIIDQIKLKTGFNIDIISHEEKSLLAYQSLRDNFTKVKKIRNQGTVIIDIGSGSIQISGYRREDLEFIQNIKLGILRINEVLSSIESRTLNFTKILEEYIGSSMDMLKNSWFYEPYINIIAIGKEVDTICRICNPVGNNNGLYYIKRKDFEDMFKKLLKQPNHATIQNHDILEEKKDTLIPSMLILKKLLDMTQAKRVYIPETSLTDGIIFDLIDKNYDTKIKNNFTEDVISSARILAKRYMYDQAHAQDIEKKSVKLFDSLKELHGLGNRERLLLKLAAILHDVGKFINMRKHYKHSYNIIKGSNFINISNEELEIIANVACYHSKLTPKYSHEKFFELGEKNRVIVAKLVAIIRIANALDTSHRQKIKDMSIKLEEKKVIIEAFTPDDILLEQWTFDMRSEFFIEVFGITPVLKKRGMIGDA